MMHWDPGGRRSSGPCRSRTREEKYQRADVFPVSCSRKPMKIIIDTLGIKIKKVENEYSGA